MLDGDTANERRHSRHEVKAGSSPESQFPETDTYAEAVAGKCPEQRFCAVCAEKSIDGRYFEMMFLPFLLMFHRS